MEKDEYVVVVVRGGGGCIPPEKLDILTAFQTLPKIFVKSRVTVLREKYQS